MARSNIFDTLSKEPLERFVLTYTDNLTAIYEYDSCEIHEFLTSLKVDTEAQKRDILFNLRKCLHEKLCEFFPDSYDELYNRITEKKLANLLTTFISLATQLLTKWKTNVSRQSTKNSEAMT